MSYISPINGTIDDLSYEAYQDRMIKIFQTVQNEGKEFPVDVLHKVFEYIGMPFLKENFVIFNPMDGSCHQDFNQLWKSQVVCLGDYHHPICYDIHKTFFSVVADENSNCLLQEGVLPGQTIEKEQMSELIDPILKMTILGSDIRGIESKRHANMRKERIKKYEIDLKRYEQKMKTFVKIAIDMNKLFLSKKITVEGESLIVSLDVEEKWEHLLEELSEGDVIYETLGEMGISAKGITPNILKSNEHLIKEVEKVFNRFNKVFIRWGKDHFADQNLHDQFHHLNLNYSVLIPSSLLEKRFRELEKIVDAKFLELTIRTEFCGFKCFIPEGFKDFFTDEIKNILKKEESHGKNSSFFYLNSVSLIRVIKNNSLKFNKDTLIHFKNISNRNYHEIEEIIYTNGKNMTMELMNRFALIIKDLLVFSNKSLVRIKVAGNVFFEPIISEKLERILTIHFDEPLVLEFSDQKTPAILQPA